LQHSNYGVSISEPFDRNTLSAVERLETVKTVMAEDVACEPHCVTWKEEGEEEDPVLLSLCHIPENHWHVEVHVPF